MAAAGAFVSENQESIAAASATAAAMAASASAAGAALVPDELKEFLKKPTAEGLHKNPVLLMMMLTYLTATRNAKAKLLSGFLSAQGVASSVGLTGAGAAAAAAA
jgi:hypothetical protein